MAKFEARFCTGNWTRIRLAIVFGWSSTVGPAIADIVASRDNESHIRIAQAQAPSAPPAAPPPVSGPVYSLTDLEFMLAPIALYPDPLLTLMMTASAFPLQVVQADRWIVANPDAVKNGNFTEADAKPWDPSVQALTRFPDVIEMLADHLDWTESLGAAFALQPNDVSTTIQMLRARAERAGNLKTTPQQTVTTREEGGTRIIYITPANPQRIYCRCTPRHRVGHAPEPAPCSLAPACWWVRPGTTAGAGITGIGTASGWRRRPGARRPAGGPIQGVPERVLPVSGQVV